MTAGIVIGFALGMFVQATIDGHVVHGKGDALVALVVTGFSAAIWLIEQHGKKAR